MKNITIHRVPQYMSKNVNVICVDGIPVCTARGNKTTSNIVAKLSGYDVEIKDGRINKLNRRIEELEKLLKRRKRND